MSKAINYSSFSLTSDSDRDSCTARVRLPAADLDAAKIPYHQPVLVTIRADQPGSQSWTILCFTALLQEGAKPLVDARAVLPADPRRTPDFQQLQTIQLAPTLCSVRIQSLTTPILNASSVKFQVPDGLQHLALLRCKLHQTLIAQGCWIHLGGGTRIQVVSVQPPVPSRASISVYRIVAHTQILVQDQSSTESGSELSSGQLDFQYSSTDSTSALAPDPVTPQSAVRNKKGSGKEIEGSSDKAKPKKKKAAGPNAESEDLEGLEASTSSGKPKKKEEVGQIPPGSTGNTAAARSEENLDPSINSEKVKKKTKKKKKDLEEATPGDSEASGNSTKAKKKDPEGAKTGDSEASGNSVKAKKKKASGASETGKKEAAKKVASSKSESEDDEALSSNIVSKFDILNLLEDE